MNLMLNNKGNSRKPALYIITVNFLHEEGRNVPITTGMSGLVWRLFLAGRVKLVVRPKRQDAP